MVHGPLQRVYFAFFFFFFFAYDAPLCNLLGYLSNFRYPPPLSNKGDHMINSIVAAYTVAFFDKKPSEVMLSRQYDGVFAFHWQFH